MLRAVEGVYRKGKIELEEVPAEIEDEARVIVTFLEPHAIDLRERGIDAIYAAELRSRLMSFAEDWDSPAMSLYDDYDSAKAGL